MQICTVQMFTTIRPASMWTLTFGRRGREEGGGVYHTWVGVLFLNVSTHSFYSFVSISFWAGAKFLGGGGWLQRMKDLGVFPDVAIEISLFNTCAKAGKPGKAEAWLVRIYDEGLISDKSYNGVANACAQAGAVEKAEQHFGLLEKYSLVADVVAYGSVKHTSTKVGGAHHVEY